MNFEGPSNPNHSVILWLTKDMNQPRSLCCPKPGAVACDEATSAELQHRGLMFSWAPWTPVQSGIKASALPKASSAADPKEAVPPTLRECWAAAFGYCCPGWSFRLEVRYQKTETTVNICWGEQKRTPQNHLPVCLNGIFLSSRTAVINQKQGN